MASKYPAPGKPELAAEVRALLKHAGLDGREDPNQGFDHGTFVPLGLMYPNADMPIVLLSLKSTYDAAEHIKVGQAIASLRRLAESSSRRELAIERVDGEPVLSSPARPLFEQAGFQREYLGLTLRLPGLSHPQARSA